MEKGDKRVLSLCLVSQVLLIIAAPEDVLVFHVAGAAVVLLMPCTCWLVSVIGASTWFIRFVALNSRAPILASFIAS